MLQSMGSQRAGQDLATEQQQVVTTYSRECQVWEKGLLFYGLIEKISLIRWYSAKSWNKATLKPLTVYITTNCGKFKEMGIPDHLTCLLRNVYVGQEATVRTRHGTMDWFKIGKGVRQGCMLSPCLFNFYAEYIMWNVRLDEAQTGIKIARRNINNLRYSDDTNLMAESKKKPKSLLMKLEEESEKADLKLNFQKAKIMASGPITSWQIDGENNGNSERLYFLGLQNHCRCWLQPWN